MRSLFWIWVIAWGSVLGTAPARSQPPAPGASVGTWRRGTSLPDEIGRAGMLAGISQGKLITAGGANFPKAPPWEGGRKTWYDTVFALDSLEGTWRPARTRLPRPLGYAVTVTHNNAVIVAGGESPTADGSEARREVFAIRWIGDDISVRPLPPLPTAVMNACGAMIGDFLFIAGGASSPTVSTKSFWMINLADRPETQAWRKLPTWDGPSRTLAVAGVANGSFYLLSGAELSAGPDGKPARRFLRDSHCFHLVAGWRRLADLPRPIVAAPGPVSVVDGRILVFGGDDGEQFQNPPQDHKGFPTGILAYDPAFNRWSDAGTIPAPRVTVPLVPWGAEWVLISGEKHPGVRSPEVWAFSPETNAP